MTEERKNQKKAGFEVKTFPVPFELGERKKNISINFNTPSKPSSERIIKQAIDFHLKGNINEAVKSYQYCINQGFITDSVFSNYAMILKDQGQLEEAEILTIKAIKINPDIANHHLLLGSILQDQGKSKEAEIATKKAIAIEPNFANAHYNLGTIFKDLGNLKEAELSIRKAIEIDPDLINAYSFLGKILQEIEEIAS
ncbi:tetratricopeptide repeat protein [Prochlorococcus marinus]|uniref:tetratricopeptide repeat protein n=1 Tax=Prochlorococcus marinus TaxID=1219 RepID=UPI0022B2C6E1|nr:tetratricopeptide repeat protein [Prochlorococcus marinus]